MARAPQADIIIALDHDGGDFDRCVRGLLTLRDELCGRLMVVCDIAAESNLLDDLAFLRSRLHIVRTQTKQSLVQLYNRGLIEREGDAVLLRSHGLVSEGWLAELAAVAHAEERTGAVCP